MTTPHPTHDVDELRAARSKRIIRLSADGHSEREIARIVGCSRTTVWSTLQSAKKAAAR